LPKLSFRLGDHDADMALCYNTRKANIFMYATNVLNFGHLIDDEVFDTTTARPDFYNFFNNMYDWERRYIHADYHKVLDGNITDIEQPCPDVYRLPLGTTRFCEDLVAIVEQYGKWSDGSNSDKRLQGGYEAVPTRDIHMNQVGLERIWLHFLKVYVRPFQEKIFLGYFHDPPRSLMNFVVRYRPDEQPSLRPHHDSSTYTINIALNTANVDYEGGGCRFLRYNCSVKETKMGYMLMHPGRLTHFHEGLLVTKGTRYIMISFIDP
jgi:procollagen-lysine,2-oxoglutarate 5-dioxygenase, invertebrate